MSLGRLQRSDGDSPRRRTVLRSPPAAPSPFTRHKSGKPFAGRRATRLQGAGRESSHRRSRTHTKIVRVGVGLGCRVAPLWHRCRSCRRHHGRPRILDPGSQSGSGADRPNRRPPAMPRGTGPPYCRSALKAASISTGLYRARPLAAGRPALHHDWFRPWGKPTLVRRTPPTFSYSPWTCNDCRTVSREVGGRCFGCGHRGRPAIVWVIPTLPACGEFDLFYCSESGLARENCVTGELWG